MQAREKLKWSKANPEPVQPAKPWRADAKRECQFGILSRLDGVWVNWKKGPKGLHTTPMPSPGTSSETIFGVFHFKSQEFREQLEFNKILEPVRNRGGSNEQFNGAVKYKTAILDNDDVLQHFENGMYIWLGDPSIQNPPSMFSHQATEESIKTDGADPVLRKNDLGPQFIPPYSISRQGVIPHGTTIHLMGNVAKHEEGKSPHIADLWEQEFLAISPSMGINPSKDLPVPPKDTRRRPSWADLSREDQVGGINSNRAYFENIVNYDKYGAEFPFTVQPNLKLSDANKDLEFISYDMIELDSFQRNGHQGGIINNVMIERYCRVVRMRMRLWLEQIEYNNKVIDQLQYEQIVDFEFMFGTNGDTTRWPHIQVNTLRRVEDVPPGDLFPEIVLPTERMQTAHS